MGQVEKKGPGSNCKCGPSYLGVCRLRLQFEPPAGKVSCVGSPLSRSLVSLMTPLWCCVNFAQGFCAYSRSTPSAFESKELLQKPLVLDFQFAISLFSSAPRFFILPSLVASKYRNFLTSFKAGTSVTFLSVENLDGAAGRKFFCHLLWLDQKLAKLAHDLFTWDDTPVQIPRQSLALLQLSQVGKALLPSHELLCFSRRDFGILEQPVSFIAVDSGYVLGALFVAVTGHLKAKF